MRECELNTLLHNAFPDEDPNFARSILIEHAQRVGYKDMARKTIRRIDVVYEPKQTGEAIGAVLYEEERAYSVCSSCRGQINISYLTEATKQMPTSTKYCVQCNALRDVFCIG